MAYSELIKNFKNIRRYMRDFYIYGFRSREEFQQNKAGSPRSYDNERRRVESWLGDYMSFRQEPSGKRFFISVDSRNIGRNPLYQAFKAKSFTRGDLLLHFYILDILTENPPLTVQEITEGISREYLSKFQCGCQPDESTVRKKLREYEEMGIINCKKSGREVRYSLQERGVKEESWGEALEFFSEAGPLGVIGDYLLEGKESSRGLFGFKHHYILHALDSEILLALFECIREKRFAVIEAGGSRGESPVRHKVIPLKIFISTQTGREYLLANSRRGSGLTFFRLDLIEAVKPGEPANLEASTEENLEAFKKHLWGVSLRTIAGAGLEHVEMRVHVGRGERHILGRLEREKRCGTVTELDEFTCLFTADVYDSMEMLPWIRTFIGRIEKLTCSNKTLTDRFYRDLEIMQSMYGGD